MAPDAQSGLPLSELTFALVGAGRVGSSLACWASARGGRATAVAVRPHADPGAGGARGARDASGAELARRLGCPAVPLAELSTAGSDLLLVAVSDPALDAVAALLARRPQAAVVLHTSGSRGAEALADLARAGAAVGSLHPLKAFPHPLEDVGEARGTTFGVGGDEAAIELAGRLAAAWDAHAVEVPDATRLLYHFGATLAAGGAVTLVAAAADLARRLGLPPQVTAGYLALARGALAATDPAAPAAAITGPVARGDAATVSAQLAALDLAAPELAELAAELARETLRLLEPAGNVALSEVLEERRRGSAPT